MNIVYLINCYRNPEQVYKLVNALQGSGDFFVNVDSKTSAKPFKKVLEKFSNVYFPKKMKNVSWGGWSLATVYIMLIKMALSSGKKYDRFVYLTGEDYPIMSNKQIIEEFTKNPTTEYIMAHKIKSSIVSNYVNKIELKWFMDCRFKNKFLRRCYLSFMYRVFTKHIKRRPLQVLFNGKLVDPYFGQTLSAFTRQGVEKIVQVYDTDKKFNKIMKHSFAPDEIYPHTIIFNSELKDNTVEHGKEHTPTEHFGWAPLHYHSYDELTSIFTEKNYEELINSGYMFCRKVMPNISDKLINMIDNYRESR